MTDDTPKPENQPRASIEMREAPVMIEGFRGDGFLLGGEYYAPPLLLTPDPVSLPPVALDEITAETLDGISPDIEIILLGTGTSFLRAPASAREAAHARGLRMDAMDSRAAARTFNLLWAEGRQVAALLL